MVTALGMAERSRRMDSHRAGADPVRIAITSPVDSATIRVSRGQEGSRRPFYTPRPRPSALVAQWIEQRFPKPCVAGSIPAGGTSRWCCRSFFAVSWRLLVG
jgi:hypothetical protein